MHSAPTVHYPVGRSHMKAAILVFPCLMAAGVGYFWLQSSVRMSLGHGLAVLLWLMVCLMTLREAFEPHESVLHWDGQQWIREAAASSQVGMPVVRLDFQRWLLLEFRSENGRSVWLWPQFKAAPQYWDALRRALYAGGPSVRDAGGQAGGIGVGAVRQGARHIHDG